MRFYGAADHSTACTVARDQIKEEVNDQLRFV